MTRLKIWLVFISLFAWRFWSYPSALPAGWTPESKVRYSVTILDRPEYSDTQTIVRSGIWYIPMKGYKEIIPGSRVSFEGVIEPRMVLEKVSQIKMVEPKVASIETGNVGYLGKLFISLGNLREGWVMSLRRTLPEPMASLAGGILLGVKGQMPEDFYQALVNTGTLHIIAASGYNVSIVAEVLMKVVGGVVSRSVGVGIGVIGIIVYVLISGGGASVVRAGVMGSLTLIAYYFGRPTEARRLLWITAGVMLLYNPLYIVDIGFQLSFVATAGILYLEPWIARLSSRARSRDPSTTVGMTKEWVGMTGKFLSDYLYPTLAATIATLPVILYHFGMVSWISPLTNILVLPLVPLIMGMTAGVLVVGRVAAWLTYPPLAYLVWVIKLFG